MPSNNTRGWQLCTSEGLLTIEIEREIMEPLVEFG